MRIIFSRDRPAQLDLLLRSLRRNMDFDHSWPRHSCQCWTKIIWFASSPDFERGYKGLADDEMQDDFNTDLREALDHGAETTTFFCDDDIVYREIPRDPSELLLANERILSVSLYLGRGNVKQNVPRHFPWDWVALPRHDFGFPCGLDGTTYRTEDVLRLIGDDTIENPSLLETVLAWRLSNLAETRPLATAFPDQCLVSVPVNRVSPSSTVPTGRTYPQSTEMLNERFLGGERIDLDALDFSDVNSVHHEIEYVWK